jgi:L-iditol 2-dehydrogenase
MYAAVLHGINDIRYQEVPTPTPGIGEVLVKVKSAAICGSDIPRVKTKGTYNFPTIPCHEFSGVVDALGEGVESGWQGKRVAVYPLISCKKCDFCVSGKDNLCDNYNYLGSRCDGAFAQYVKTPVANLLPLPDAVTFEQASLIEPLGVAMRGLNKAGVKAGDEIVVFGLGTIGLSVVQLAIQRGARVTGIDRNSHKLEIARSFGATAVTNLEEVGKCDAVIECTGSEVFNQAAIEKVKKSGVIARLGNPSGVISFPESNFQNILRKELTITGVWNSLLLDNVNEWRDVLGVMPHLQPEKIITHRFNLSDAKEVFDKLHAREYDGYCKGVFVL